MSSASSSNGVDNPRLVFIGGGNMADALIKGCVAKGFVSKENVIISVKTEKSAEKWKSTGFASVFTNNQEMLEKYPTAIYVLSVKPQIFDEVVSIWPVNSRPRMIISVMAGIPLELLKTKLSFLAESTTLIRIMPNVASSIGAGASSMCYEEQNIENQKANVQFAKSFAECVGTVEIIPERCFNAALAVAASSPAWVFMFVEALADGAVAKGLGRAEAKRMAAQAVLGAAKMLVTPESGFDIDKQHMGALKDQVCSPGGTTIEGVRILEKNGFRSSVIEAVIGCAGKADEMAKAFSK